VVDAQHAAPQDSSQEDQCLHGGVFEALFAVAVEEGDYGISAAGPVAQAAISALVNK
jgi:hypothetical protein